MSKRVHLLVFLAAAGLLFVATSRGAPLAADDELAPFKDNSCVTCHSRENRTSVLTNKYLEWHLSLHKIAGVSCDKCHGGDPTNGNADKSHSGMLPTKDVKSRTNPVNLPATCGTCHAGIASSFTTSKHFASVAKNVGGGPSCSTCHDHMGADKIVVPADVSALCATCHVAGGSTAAAQHVGVPAKAEEVLAALERASAMQVWAEGLFDAAKQKKLDVAAEDKELKAAGVLLDDARAAWHEFTLVGVTDKADNAFNALAKAKDSLRKKMGYT